MRSKKPYGLSDEEWRTILLAAKRGWFGYAVMSPLIRFVCAGVLLSFFLAGNLSWVITDGPKPSVNWVAVTDLATSSILFCVVLGVSFRTVGYFGFKRPLVEHLRRKGRIQNEEIEENIQH